MEYTIRKKERKDCMEVAHIVTVTWNETYKGIVPDSFLENLYNNEEERGKNSFDNFDEKTNNEYVLIVDNNIVGFMNIGNSRETGYENCGEIFALYIINKYKGNGFGRELINTGINELKKMGYKDMIICCLEGNKTNEFYKHIGGKLVKTKIHDRLQLPENIYYFEKI